MRSSRFVHKVGAAELPRQTVDSLDLPAAVRQSCQTTKTSDLFCIAAYGGPSNEGAPVTVQRLEVVIVGAGLSGIGAAVELRRRRPDTSFAILEMRAVLGGTWDLFRYPGIRSDSDMYTLAYSFKPWTDEKAIASAQAILDYLDETVEEYELSSFIHYESKVLSAAWSSDAQEWTLTVETPEGRTEMKASFLYTAAGYYNYDEGYLPQLPGMEAFAGTIVHPQSWPEDLDYTEKRVAVIGSGATAVTLIPAMAGDAAKVTMIQRSPSYVLIDSDVDQEANELRESVGAAEAFRRVRQRNMISQQERYQAARLDPEGFKKPLFAAIDEIVGQEVREKHFMPAYEPWDQRLCLVPNGDLFHAIREGKADVVTGAIETFTHDGVRMSSGEFVAADIVVAATGLEILTLGGIQFSIDGREIDFADTWSYKGVAFSGVPNLINAFGYINSSWTLRIELVNAFWCDVLDRMEKLGATSVTPTLRANDGDMQARPWILDVNSGYLLRGMSRFPRQGDRDPWQNPQVHEATKALLTTDPEDGVLQFNP
jgi:monooxygenase